MEDRPIEFRLASRSDLPELLRLYAQLGSSDTDVLELGEAQSRYFRIESYPDYKIHLALAGGAVVGTWSMLVMDNLAHKGLPTAIVENVVVDNSCRGMGIGQAMMLQAMRIAREKGCYKLALTSGQHRPEAHRFYEKLGFRRHGYSFYTELES
jgi:GNAT superfamily N-acetyltransferase